MGHPFQSAFNLRQHEILPVVLAVLYFFCVLTALMVLRPARESLGIQGGIDTVRWLFIGTAVVTLARKPGVRLAGQQAASAFVHLRHLPVLQCQSAGVLQPDDNGAGCDRDNHRAGVLRVVQRIQFVCDHGVLGADGRSFLS